MKPELHVVPTFHHDIAYLHPETWYRDRAFQILDRATALMEADETYTFTVEQTYFFRDYWAERPELHEKLKRYTQRGQLLFAPGFWVVPDMSMPNGESIYMQACFGQAFLEESVGYVPKSAFIADCWGHHAQLPQILTQCGYRYYVFSRCMLPEWDQENFRWQGLDGSEIFTHWMSTGYAGIRFPDEAPAVNAEELHWEQSSRQGILQLRSRNAAKCGTDVQLLPAGGDMAMPGQSSPFLMKKLQADPDLPPIAFSSMESALGSVDFDQKPCFSGEFIGSLKGTFVTNIELKQKNRQTEAALYSLEALAVLKQKKLCFTGVWETLLKNQFHDILCGTICNEAVLQAHREYGEAEKTLEEMRKTLAEGTPGWFNSLNFPVSEIRCTEDEAVRLTADGFGFADAEKLEPEEIPLPEAFENEYYRATFDKNGCIRELWEKKSGEKVVDAPAIPFGSLQLQVDNGDNWVEFEYPWEKDTAAYVVNDPDPYDRSHLPTHPRTMISRSNVRGVSARRLGDEGVQIVQTGSMNYWQTNLPFTITMTLSKSSPRIDYRTQITCTSRRLRVRAAFPTACQKGRIRHQIPFGLAERTEGPQAAQMFMDYESDAAGLALMNCGLPQNNTEDGIMLLTLMRSVAMEYKCDSDLSYGDGKTYTFDYAVCPHPAKSADDLLWEQALSFNHPMVASSVTDLNGFAVQNAYVSALRAVDDDVFLRIYNGTDREKTVTVQVPAAFGRVAQTDGCMRPATPAGPVEKGELHITLAPFKVLGLRFLP